MNQFSDNNPQPEWNEGVEPQQCDHPVAGPPTPGTEFEALESSAEQLEAKINRLIGSDAGSPVPTQSSYEPYDVLDYARLSSQRPGLAQPLTDSDLQRFGEKDPYVNPEDLVAKELPNKQTYETKMTNSEVPTESGIIEPIKLVDSADQTLEEINDFQQQLEMLESNSAVHQIPKTQTTVEVICSGALETDLVNIAGKAADSSLELTEQLPPTAWFADSANEPMPTKEPQSAHPAVPIMNQETGEPIFDVRDFCESAEFVPEPIPGAYEVAPDLFDFKTIDEVESCSDSCPAGPNSLQNDVSQDGHACVNSTDQIFVAGAGDVVQINGADGFDHIDLACFDVKWATFFEQVIHVDDQQGSSFEIHFQDIGYALFADGVEVRLDGQDLG